MVEWWTRLVAFGSRLLFRISLGILNVLSSDASAGEFQNRDFAVLRVVTSRISKSIIEVTLFRSLVLRQRGACPADQGALRLFGRSRRTPPASLHRARRPREVCGHGHFCSFQWCEFGTSTLSGYAVAQVRGHRHLDVHKRPSKGRGRWPWRREACRRHLLYGHVLYSSVDSLCRVSL